jgi:hypothetical protein
VISSSLLGFKELGDSHIESSSDRPVDSLPIRGAHMFKKAIMAISGVFLAAGLSYSQTFDPFLVEKIAKTSLLMSYVYYLPNINERLSFKKEQAKTLFDDLSKLQNFQELKDAGSHLNLIGRTLSEDQLEILKKLVSEQANRKDFVPSKIQVQLLTKNMMSKDAFNPFYKGDFAEPIISKTLLFLSKVN